MTSTLLHIGLPPQEAEKRHELKAAVDDINKQLGALRGYLAPTCLYHKGKRGGTNYNRPRQLLEDLEALIPSTR